MPSPKPISLTQAATTPTKGTKPQGFVVVGDFPAASATAVGGVKKAATVANATVATDGTSAGTQLNLLLTSLRAAGIIA